MGNVWSTVLICAVLVVICVFGVRSYIKKLKSGCCGGGGDEVKKVRPSDGDVSHYNYSYKIGIDGMSCKNCVRKVENAFNEREGFYAVVDLKQNDAMVRTKEPVSETELRRIVQSAGYGAADVEAVGA